MRDTRTIEQIAAHLKSKAAMALRAARCHPLQRFEQGGTIPTPWSVGSWSVFMSEDAHVRSAIDYVTRHPLKEGLTPQRWVFVEDFPSAPV